MCVLSALAYSFLQHLHAACIGQRAAARPVWVLLMEGGTHGHHLQLWRYILHREFVRPFDEDCRELEANSFLCKEFGKKFASACGFWMDRVPLSRFHGPHLLWRSCQCLLWPSNLGTGTYYWCLEFWDVRYLSLVLVPACLHFASDPCQLRARGLLLTLISMPHHVVNSCTTSSKSCTPSGVSAKIEMSSIKTT